MKKKGAAGKGEGPVYSTGHGRMCPACGRPRRDCQCRQKAPLPEGDGIVRIGRETRGRKGKGVTVIIGVRLNQDGLRKLAGELKQRCGCGGTVKEGVIEIQGDHRAMLLNELRRRGWTVKPVGG